MYQLDGPPWLVLVAKAVAVVVVVAAEDTYDVYDGHAVSGSRQEKLNSTIATKLHKGHE